MGALNVMEAESSKIATVPDLTYNEQMDIESRRLIIAANAGDLESVKKLHRGGANINGTNNDGVTALTSAAWEGHLEVVQYLCDNGAIIDKTCKIGNTALINSARGRVEVVRYLVEKGASVNIQSKNGDCAVSWAAHNGRLDVVQYLVKHEANIDYKTIHGETALMRAAQYGHLNVVQYLVEQGVDVQVKSNVGDTALSLAVDRGYLEIASYLINRGSDTGTKNEYGWTALMRAVWNDRVAVVDYLMEVGAKQISGDLSAGRIHQSNFQGLIKITRVAPVPGCHKPTIAFKSVFSGLYLDGRNPEMRDVTLSSEEQNPATDLGLQWIISDAGKGHVYIKSASSDQYLDGRNYGMRDPILTSDDPDPTTNEHLQWVIGEAGNGCNFMKNVSSGQYLDGRNPEMRDATLSSEEQDPATDAYLQWDIESLDSDSLIALKWAARWGRLGFMHFLIQLGATVDACDCEGRTVLMWAASGGHIDIVCFLVKARVAVDAHDKNGQTPLMLAASNGHLEVVRYLVENGADKDARDNRCWTPLMLSAVSGHLDIVNVLVEQGAAMDACGNDVRTLLLESAGCGHLDVVRFLMELGANVNVQNSSGATPLMLAADGGHLEVVRFLLDHKSDVDIQNSGGATLVMQATNRGHLDIVRYLVEHGIDVNIQIREGVTPLMLAAYSGHLDIVHFLVDQDAVIDAPRNDGATPLMCAANIGHLNVMRFLLDCGAAVDACYSDGSTLLMWSARDGCLDMVRFLVEHRATVNVYNNDKWTPLMFASCDGHFDVVKVLVERGGDVNARNAGGWTPLMWAARHGHCDVVRYLVEHNADVNMKSETGDTTLSSAARFGHQDIVQFLLPLVRYHDQMALTEHVDKNLSRSTNMPTNWLISPFDVVVEPFDNAGNIGGDYRGQWLDADVVVKLFVDDASSSSFVDEVRLWHQLRHPNVLKLYGVCNSAHYLFVYEYASNGSLLEYLESCSPKHRTPWKFLHEAALGLEYLHERKIFHGNLRGSNILIGSDGLAKLSIFGLSVSSTKGKWSTSGAWVRWASPESLRNNKVSLASDVYSLGMCIVETVTGEVPYYKMNETDARFVVKYEESGMSSLNDQMHHFSEEQRELVRVMCRDDPCKRVQMSTVVNKLERFAEMETTRLLQHTTNTESESHIEFDAFDYLKSGETSSIWSAVQTLVDKSENELYHKLCDELEMIYDTLKANTHPWSTLERFHGLLSECQLALDGMSQQNQICRLSATRARDHSVQGLHRRISQLLQLVRPQDQDAETRETEWKRLCREQVEVFVSEASEACVMLSSIDSEEDRLALITVLRAELRNSDRKYTEKQLEVLQKTYDEIVSKSLEDVHLATAPEWFIPWFELEMNEMKTLGIGGFGSVIKAKWLDSEVVVKKLEIDPKDAANPNKKRKMRQMFEHEVDVWFGLSHPHVVRLFGACHVGRPFFVCELAPNGTLDKYLRCHPDELWSKLREAALGVQYLHARGIVHGDLKGNNILIGSDGKAKVTDFGLSGMFGDDSTEVMLTGAWHWVAPECILGQKPTFASDVYSLGMCIIEALRVTNGNKYTLPWGDLLNAAVKYQVTEKHLFPQRPNHCSDEAWTLIERMCKNDPADRMLIMTVVDELDKLADRHEDLRGETDQIVIDIGKMRLSSSSVANALAEMKSWIAKCDTRSDWERGVLKNIYQLLWDRLEQVAIQLSIDGDITDVANTTICAFAAVVDRSQMRTREALDITDGFPLAKFTEMALGAYSSHRCLDKFLAAHTVSNGSSSLHNWTSACSTLMGVSASLIPAAFEEEHSVDNVATSFIQFVCRNRSKPIQNLTYESSLLIEHVQDAQEEIDGYFIKQGELPDICCQQEIARVIETWLEKSKAHVSIATETALDHLPRTFSASNSAQLSSTLEAFHQTVKQTLQACTEECKSSITAILGKRQGQAVASFSKIQQILTTFGIELPGEMKPKFASVAANTEIKHDLFYKVNAWLVKMVDLMKLHLARDVRPIVRVKVVAGSIYDAECNFAGGTTSAQVGIYGQYIAGDSHVKLSHHKDLKMSCQVGSDYAGQSFMLVLSHLTSDAGPTSSAPVTVRVNGNTIRENFCPRAMHEYKGHKVGVWWYETDRWHVSSSFIHDGENIVSISYCDHGTSHYWIRSLGLHCALPRKSTYEIHSRDVKEFFDTAMTTQMQLGQDQKLLIERVVQESSPMRALKTNCQRYIRSIQTVGRA